MNKEMECNDSIIETLAETRAKLCTYWGSEFRIVKKDDLYSFVSIDGEERISKMTAKEAWKYMCIVMNINLDK